MGVVEEKRVRVRQMGVAGCGGMVVGVGCVADSGCLGVAGCGRMHQGPIHSVLTPATGVKVMVKAKNR